MRRCVARQCVGRSTRRPRSARLAGLADMADIEILYTFDDDGFPLTRVFIDGQEVYDYGVFQVDPGAGWLRSEWDEMVNGVRNDTAASPAFRQAALEALEAASNSPFITEG